MVMSTDLQHKSTNPTLMVLNLPLLCVLYFYKVSSHPTNYFFRTISRITFEWKDSWQLRPCCPRRPLLPHLVYVHKLLLEKGCWDF